MATDHLPPPPPGCAWLPLHVWADAHGLSRNTANSWAWRGEFDGKAKPLGVKRGERWFVAARLAPLPEKRPVPVPDLPEGPPVDAQTQALARDLAAALAPYLRAK